MNKLSRFIASICSRDFALSKVLLEDVLLEKAKKRIKDTAAKMDKSSKKAPSPMKRGKQAPKKGKPALKKNK